MTEKIINHENNSAPIINTLYRQTSGTNTLGVNILSTNTFNTNTLKTKPLIHLPLVSFKTHDVIIQITPPNEQNLITKRKERINHYVQAAA